MGVKSGAFRFVGNGNSRKEIYDKLIGSNKLDGRGGMGTLGKVIARDDWVVAFNFLDNNIKENGAKIFKKSIRRRYY
mgnify:CR=1 FL=1